MKRIFSILIVCLVTCIIPFVAGAQQDETQIPVLLSTGISTTETPEDILPTGAVAYLRANNILKLMENLDSLLTTFVPKNALPPDFQPLFESAQPFIAFLGMQIFGQPVELSEIPNLLGIALDRPVSLAFYPMEPDKGFILSVPIAHPTVAAGIVQETLRPRMVEQGAIGDVNYFQVVPAIPDMPRNIFILASETTAFFCGSLDVAQMLVNSVNMGIITTDPGMAKGIKKYENRDLSLVISPGFIKLHLPSLKPQLAGILAPAFQEIRAGVDAIPPAERLMIDARLRLELGVESLEQLVDYAEAYSSGLYRVLLEKGLELLTNLDGLTLALDIEEKFQNTSLTLFSQAIEIENLTQPLPLETIRHALAALPGDKSTLFALGKVPEAGFSTFVSAILTAIEEELKNRGLALDVFFAFKDYYLAKQYVSPLASKVDWTVKTLIPAAEKTDFSQFNSTWELLKYTVDRISGGPFLFSLTFMPSTSNGLIEQYFTEKAEILTQNGQLYGEMRAKLPIKQPFFDCSSQFHPEDAGENVKKLTFENIYTTRRGFFGYQQHELINRRIMFYNKLAEYDIVYDAVADEAQMENLLSMHPVPQAAAKLLELAPEGTNGLSLFRTLHFLSDLLNILNGVEDLIHHELDSFLAKTQEIIDTHGEEEIEEKLLEARLDLPLLMMSLQLDEDGKVYCLLPGGLYYPRPKVLPKAKELFVDFLETASEIGGSASFMAVRQGEFELSSVQSTEALAFLGQTVVNNFFEKYMSSPEGMELLQTSLMHPADFQDLSEEEIFMNPLWKMLMESENLLFSREIQRSKQLRTAADIRTIGTALGSYQVDFNFYPKQVEAVEIQDAGLPPEYYSGSYLDGWERPIMYLSDEDGENYLLISYGKDGLPGITRDEFDADIIYINWKFIAPVGSLNIEEDVSSELNAALILAVKGNAVDIVEALLESWADPNATDEEGETALSLAEELGYDDIVELLEDAGAY